MIKACDNPCQLPSGKPLVNCCHLKDGQCTGIWHWSDFDKPKFTAPVTGKYQVSASGIRKL